MRRVLWMVVLFMAGCVSSKAPPRPVDLLPLVEGLADDVWKATVYLAGKIIQLQ